jgi:hypothetical protein
MACCADAPASLPVNAHASVQARTRAIANRAARQNFRTAITDWQLAWVAAELT